MRIIPLEEYSLFQFQQSARSAASSPNSIRNCIRKIYRGSGDWELTSCPDSNQVSWA